MIKDGKVQWNGNSKIDANGLFMGQQLAFVEAGRWLMPLFKDIKDFEFDIYIILEALNSISCKIIFDMFRKKEMNGNKQKT